MSKEKYEYTAFENLSEKERKQLEREDYAARKQRRDMIISMILNIAIFICFLPSSILAIARLFS